MNLMTKEFERQMPPISSQQNVEDPHSRLTVNMNRRVVFEKSEDIESSKAIRVTC